MVDDQKGCINLLIVEQRDTVMGNQQSFFNQWIAGIGNDVEEGLDNLFWSGPRLELHRMDAEWLLCRNGPLGSESRDCTQLTHLGSRAGRQKISP